MPTPEPQSESDIDHIHDDIRRLFVRILSIFALVATISWITIVWVFHLTRIDVPFELLFVASSVGLYALTYAKRPTIASWFAAFLAFIITLYFNIFPGKPLIAHEFSSITIYPLIAFFLLGGSFGIVSTIIYFIISIGSLFLGLSTVSVPTAAITQLAFNIATATFIIYFYLVTERSAQKLITKITEEQKATIHELNKEVELRKKAEEQLQLTIKEIQEKKQELESLNALMIGREIAMTELKAKIKQLEERVSA